MRTKTLILTGSVAALVSLLVYSAMHPAVTVIPESAALTSLNNIQSIVGRINQHFEKSWIAADLQPAVPAGELSILRRLSLALHGTIPSLEEIRAFEADQNPDRLARWTTTMLEDARFADYFAERLARSYVGTENGAFIIYRRDRFTSWLSAQFQTNRPYDEIVREMIAEQGLWTGEPATNFITAAVVEGDVDENKLAGKCVRAFLGQRIDCAQCHDHFFASWKQAQFQGLAAHFGQAKISVIGIEDGRNNEFTVQDPKSQEDQVIAPAVPFGQDWLPESGTRREQLAAWITHPENRRFERAIANRIWGLMFGNPLVSPVDDIPDPGDPLKPDVLDLLGEDFRTHHYDLRRLIQVIAASRPFRASSLHPTEDEKTSQQLIDTWGMFPLTRLRPEQIVGSILQAGSLKTIDQNSHLLIRMIRFFRERDFIQEYGDLGDEELTARAGTIPQALLRMNGQLPAEIADPNPFSAPGRIAGMSASPEACVEACYLVCLSRRPSPEERDHFLEQMQDSGEPGYGDAVEDIFWSLFNSPEFSWNH